MKTLLTSSCLALAMALSACTNATSTSTPQPTPMPQAPIVGGFSPADINSSEVQAAAQFAAQALGGLLSKVTKAEQQVVAGMNYRMNIELQDGTKHTVVVYKDLQGNMSLTSK